MLYYTSAFTVSTCLRRARFIWLCCCCGQAFNNPSTYVKAAKFQRLANAKEKELAALQSVKEITAQDRIDATVATIKVIGNYVVLTNSSRLHILFHTTAYLWNI